jgi:hypothetical protein
MVKNSYHHIIIDITMSTLETTGASARVGTRASASAAAALYCEFLEQQERQEQDQNLMTDMVSKTKDLVAEYLIQCMSSGMNPALFTKLRTHHYELFANVTERFRTDSDGLVGLSEYLGDVQKALSFKKVEKVFYIRFFMVLYEPIELMGQVTAWKKIYAPSA